MRRLARILIDFLGRLATIAAGSWALAWLMGADSSSSEWLRHHRTVTLIVLGYAVAIYSLARWLEEPNE